MFLDTLYLFKGKSRLNKSGIVEKELTAAINGLTEVNNFTIITFNSKIRKWRNSLVPANERNKFNAVSFVKEINPRGETNIYNALKEAFKITERENNNVTFFLLTDGAPSMGQIKKPEYLLEKINEWNIDNKVTIHTISLGEGTDKVFLQNVAGKNNGLFIER